ncbi:MAG: hypothetical protein KC983_12410, partial [Phycisphaerales bacterium]|nr:hypothetical protein [Phycisphaerales bacterium]
KSSVTGTTVEREPILAGDADIDRFTATGSVQVRLESGARIFADVMDGSAPEQRVMLTGEDVIIVAERLLLERGRSYELRKSDGVMRGNGQGEARIFSTPVLADTRDPVAPPTSATLDTEPDVFASWSESMRFDSLFNDEAGALDLRGNVDAISRPSAVQLDSLKGQSLRMEFVFANDVDNRPAGGANDALLSIDRGQRALGVMLADGDARLESRIWEHDDLSDTPRVFYISGPMIRYNNQSGDALVDGAGEMLTRDVRPSEVIGGDREAFSARVVTRFRWAESLAMIHAFGDRYDVTMTGDVEVVHQSLYDDVTTITGETLGVTMLRTQTGEEMPATDAVESGALGFGGDVDIRRLWGHGRLFIRTPTREVECDRFDYNRYTELARIEADPGRTVTVKDRQSARPVNAQVVLWNLRDDSITIERAGG